MDLFELAFNLSDKVIILGDMNYDYKLDATLATNPIHSMEALFEMTQLVETPTRMTTTSSTLLDVILSSAPNYHVTTKVLPVSVSDHLPVITTIRCRHKPKADHKLVRFRDYKHFVVTDFIDDLRLSPIVVVRQTIRNFRIQSSFGNNSRQFSWKCLRNMHP